MGRPTRERAPKEKIRSCSTVSREGIILLLMHLWAALRHQSSPEGSMAGAPAERSRSPGPHPPPDSGAERSFVRRADRTELHKHQIPERMMRSIDYKEPEPRNLCRGKGSVGAELNACLNPFVPLLLLSPTRSTRNITGQGQVTAARICS